MGRRFRKVELHIRCGGSIIKFSFFFVRWFIFLRSIVFAPRVFAKTIEYAAERHCCKTLINFMYDAPQAWRNLKRVETAYLDELDAFMLQGANARDHEPNPNGDWDLRSSNDLEVLRRPQVVRRPQIVR